MFGNIDATPNLSHGSISLKDDLHVRNYKDNLFCDISSASRKELERGQGRELDKLTSLKSSTAIMLNFFEYWKQMKKYSMIAKVCQCLNDKSFVDIVV